MYSLPKRERLHLKRDIDELFAQGKGFVAYPLRVIHLPTETMVPEMLVSVSKRHFKRANKRNRVKRLIREAYRLNKHRLAPLLAGQRMGLRMAFIFVGQELPSYAQIEAAIEKAFNRLNQVYTPPPTEHSSSPAESHV